VLNQKLILSSHPKGSDMKNFTEQIKALMIACLDGMEDAGKVIPIDLQNRLMKAAMDMLNQKLTDGFVTPEEEAGFFRAALPLYISLSGFISRQGEESHPHWISGDPVLPGVGRPLLWTGTKAEAVELIYELVTVGVFNNGRTTIMQLTRWFEKEFQIEIRNVPKIFQEIRNRRKETTFLALKMDKALREYIDQLDNEEEERNGNWRRA
jgi:RteC protein